MRITQHGFTMIELIVVITIVGILMAVGAPSYRNVTTSNRISGEINGMVGDLQYARSEAIKQGITVTACASTDGATCVGAGSTWNTGWIVFLDNNGSASVDAGDSIMRVQRGFSGTDTLTADTNTSAVSFNREGFATGLGAAVTMRLHDSSNNAGYTRCLQISIVGAMTTQKKGTGNCT